MAYVIKATQRAHRVEPCLPIQGQLKNGKDVQIELLGKDEHDIEELRYETSDGEAISR